MSRPAVFFDRDGVVNRSPGEGYVLSWQDFHLSPGIRETLQLCKSKGYALVLVTSQQGVGKALMTQADLDDIHLHMQQLLTEAGAAFDQIESCTHLAGTCSCRKPSPEMVLKAAADLDLDLAGSWLVGDHDRDIQMAANAGVAHTIRVLGDHQSGTAADFSVGDVAELHALFSNHLPPLTP